MADLQSLHAELLEALSELEALTAASTCDKASLSAARYRLSRVSGTRRRLIDELCEQHLRRASSEEARALRALRQSNLEARVASTKHIGIWTLQEAASNWAGYRAASARVRSAMREQIRVEQALLYPQLRQAA